jgi:hypothetical protein
MEPFALTFLGLVLGITFCVIAFAAFLLYQAAAKTREQAAAVSAEIANHVRNLTSAISGLDDRVSAALTKLDAAQLHESALQIQRSGARLARTVSMLYKLALSQDGTAAIAAEELAEEDINPYSGKPYAGDMSTAGTGNFGTGVAAGLPLSPEDAVAYQEHLRQRFQEKLKQEAMSQQLQPLPDLDEAYEAEEKEQAGASGNLSSFAPEGGFR